MEAVRVVVMGVSGCGKSTVGERLAERTGWPFLDADRLHPATNVAKMARGEPLTDSDRWPWLDLVATWIAARRAAAESGIIGCSALKRSYRDRLRGADPDLRVAYLSGDRGILLERLVHRHGHFFPTQLLDSQLADLEPPAADERPIIVQIGQSPDAVVDAILAGLGVSGPPD
jgi:carbohydrate kinase (thermoresistant glucokinase family)